MELTRFLFAKTQNFSWRMGPSFQLWHNYWTSLCIANATVHRT